jgi:hypothetical protein
MRGSALRVPGWRAAAGELNVFTNNLATCTGGATGVEPKSPTWGAKRGGLLYKQLVEGTVSRESFAPLGRQFTSALYPLLP